MSGAANIGQFAANQILQNGTSAMVSQALGLEADLGDALQNALASTFAAAGFNLVGDLSAPGNWDLQGGSPAKIGLHALMGGLAAEAAGGDFRIGALAAGVNEALIDSLALQYAGMDPDKKKGLLVMNSQVIGVLVAAAQGSDDADSLQTGAWVAGNATKYNHFELPAGLTQYGQSATSLGQHMQEQGVSSDAISAALRDHARGLGFEGPDPATELLKAGGQFVPAGLGVVISAPVTLGSVAVGAIASGGVEYFYQYNIDTGSVVLTDVGKASLIGALSQGKNLPVTVMVNVGGEYAYKKVKNEEIGASLVSATLGSAAGWKASSKIYDGLGKGVPDSVRTSLSSLLESYASKNISAVTEDLAEGK